MKVTSWITLAVVLLILVLSVSIGLYFYVDSVLTSSFFEGILESATGRSVTIQTVEFNPFTGIALRNVSVRTVNDTGGETLFHADLVDVGVRYSSLLWGRLRIGELQLVRPVISSYRDEDGVWQFVFQERTDSTEALFGEESINDRTMAQTTNMPFRIDRLQVTDGVLSVEDRQSKQDWTVSLNSILIRGLTSELTGRITFRDVRMNQTELRGTVQFGFDPLVLKSSDLSLKRVELEELRKLPLLEDRNLPSLDEFSNPRVSTRFDTLLLTESRQSMGGQFRLTDLNLVDVKYKGEPIQYVAGRGSLNRTGSTLQLGVSEVSINDRQTASRGSLVVERRNDTPRVNAELLLRDFFAGRLSGLSPWIARLGLSRDKLISGEVEELSVEADGPLNRPNLDATFRFNNLTLSDDSSPPEAGPRSLEDGVVAAIGSSKTPGLGRGTASLVDETLAEPAGQDSFPIGGDLLQSTGRLGFSGRVNLSDTGGLAYRGIQGSVAVDFGGLLSGQPFQVEGRVPVPDPFRRDLHLKGHVNKLEVRDLISVVESSVGPIDLKGQGPVSLELFRLRGTSDGTKLYLKTNLEGLNLESSNLPQAFYDLRGSQILNGEIHGEPEKPSDWLKQPLRLVGNVRGKIGLHPFVLGGTVPLQGLPDESVDLKGNVGLFKLESIKELLPGDPLPGSVRASGPLSIPDFRVTGTLANPDLGASIRAHGLTVLLPFLDDSITNVEGQVHYTSDRIRVEGINGTLRDRSLFLEGQLEKQTDVWEPDLHLKTSALPVSLVVENLRQAPEFPAGWKPGGSIQVNASLSDSLHRPRITGQYRSPSLTLGELRVRDLNGTFAYEDGGITLRSSDGEVFDGEFAGGVTSRSSPSATRVRLDGTLDDVKMKSVATSFEGLEYGLKGRLSGEVELTGKGGDFSQMSGSVNLRGQKLDFSDIAALRQLSIVLNTSLTRAIETSVFGTALNLLTFNIREGARAARTLLSSELTTQFKRAHGKIEFDEGKGEIRKLELSNSELTLTVDGVIWLDGRLRITVVLKPKTPILNRIEKDWLQGIISGGFPEFKVHGSINNPNYKLKGLQKGLQGRIQRILWRILTLGFY